MLYSFYSSFILSLFNILRYILQIFCVRFILDKIFKLFYIQFTFGKVFEIFYIHFIRFKIFILFYIHATLSDILKIFFGDFILCKIFKMFYILHFIYHIRYTIPFIIIVDDITIFILSFFPANSSSIVSKGIPKRRNTRMLRNDSFTKRGVPL